MREKYSSHFTLCLVICISMISISSLASGSMTRTIPSFPLTNETIGTFSINLGGGYPLFNHSYTLFSDDEYLLHGQHKNQTLTLVPYNNPPLFPNETVYGILHEENGYVSWVKVFTDPNTGIVRLCQVADTGEFGETPYQKNLSPAENDYLGRIEWLVVYGKIWPRTWINGTMYEGQSWTEWWGPFPPDKEGSVFRKRDTVVRKVILPIAGNQTEVYEVSITGPSETNEGINRTENLYFLDGVGPVGHDIIETTEERINLHSKKGMPEDAPDFLPAGTTVFSHQVRCNTLVNNSHVGSITG